MSGRTENGNTVPESDHDRGPVYAGLHYGAKPLGAASTLFRDLGSVKRKVLPLPTSLSTDISPP